MTSRSQAIWRCSILVGTILFGFGLRFNSWDAEVTDVPQGLHIPGARQGLAHVPDSSYAYFMTEESMKENRSILRGCGVGMLVLLLAFVLMFSTMRVLRHSDHFSCFGQLGAGFPVSFFCDYSGGGSPISSAGKIDLADFPYFSPVGTLVDMLFYSIQLGTIWLIANRISRKGPEGFGKYRWATLIIALYLAGFLSALILLQPARLRIERSYPRTPTPIASPTTIGTNPAPPFTPGAAAP